jgi:hypothetical protein
MPYHRPPKHVFDLTAQSAEERGRALTEERLLAIEETALYAVDLLETALKLEYLKTPAR